MEHQYIFKEQQRFRHWWLWMLLLSINLLFLYGFVQQVILGKQIGDRHMNDGALTVALVFNFILTLLFFLQRLDTLIKNDGVYVRFYPFQFKYRKHPWENLKKAYVREYSPLSEYGGWGLRFGVSEQGRAYNVSGNKGLQLEFTDQKRLLIGTRKPDELSLALKRIGQLKV